MELSLQLSISAAFLKFVLVLLCLWSGGAALFEFKISLNSSNVRDQITQFWRSTGFCPPLPHEDVETFILSPDMQQNIAYIGAIPFHGITQIRVHWLLDLVKVKRMTSKGPEYDFSKLDGFVALMHMNELQIGFELMGNPSDLYTDMENQTQVYWWRDLVSQTAHRYVSLYDVSYVKQWNFETWNEPDCHDFDKLKMTVQGFLNYYDACSEGLKAVDSSLKFGGPGDGCMPFLEKKSTVYADALLNHTIRGINYFTGEKGVRIDFLSFHNKGDGQGIKIIEKEIANIKHVESNFPELKDEQFFNDEADPLVGWSKPLLWRANVVYAGLVAKIVNQHQNIFKAKADPAIENYALLSNDNGFLSFYPNQFTQRTLLARFQMNVTKPHYVTFVRKPVYITLTLLALLGDRQVHVDLSADGNQLLSNTSDFGALATIHEPGHSNNSDSWQMTLLIYGATDPDNRTDYASLDLSWYIDPPASTTGLKLMIYNLYDGWGNPYDIWTNLFNKTDFPTLKQFAKIREQEEPYRSLSDVSVKKGKVIVPPRFQILDPHVVLMHLCSKPAQLPEKVTGVRFITVTSGQILIVWSDSSIYTKCLLTYEVELSTSGSAGPYHRVNQHNSIITAFLYETEARGEVEGHYRICATDFWNRKGTYSDPALYQMS